MKTTTITDSQLAKLESIHHRIAGLESLVTGLLNACFKDTEDTLMEKYHPEGFLNEESGKITEAAAWASKSLGCYDWVVDNFELLDGSLNVIRNTLEDINESMDNLMTSTSSEHIPETRT